MDVKINLHRLQRPIKEKKSNVHCGYFDTKKELDKIIKNPYSWGTSPQERQYLRLL
jgi:hypothetical protein